MQINNDKIESHANEICAKFSVYANDIDGPSDEHRKACGIIVCDEVLDILLYLCGTHSPSYQHWEQIKIKLSNDL